MDTNPPLIPAMQQRDTTPTETVALERDWATVLAAAGAAVMLHAWLLSVAFLPAVIGLGLLGSRVGYRKRDALVAAGIWWFAGPAGEAVAGFVMLFWWFRFLSPHVTWMSRWDRGSVTLWDVVPFGPPDSFWAK